MILDCQTRETALDSLSAIIGVTPDRLTQGLAGIYYDRWSEDPPTVLWQEIVGGERTCDGIYWFHLSRVLDPESFRQRGILPLNEMVEPIWLMLAELAGDSISEEDKRQLDISLIGCGHSAWLYNEKVHNLNDWGPNAMLVRDSAFCPRDMLNHDYLGAPEIVEDICDCINRRFGVDLLTRFCGASQSCIVKFLGPFNRPDVLPTALMYLWAMHHDQGMGYCCNTCFDGEGEAIRPDQIVAIEVDL